MANILYVIGAGTGMKKDLTCEAYNLLISGLPVYIDERYALLLKREDLSFNLRPCIQSTHARCKAALLEARSGNDVCILASGDTNIYSIASIICEQNAQYKFSVDIRFIGGLPVFLAAASRLGAPLCQDFAVITLSDQLADKSAIRQKIIALAQMQISIVFYSPSNYTKQNLIEAADILKQYRCKNTSIGVVKHLGMVDECVIITSLAEFSTEEIDEFTLVFIGSKNTYYNGTHMITPLLTESSNSIK